MLLMWVLEARRRDDWFHGLGFSLWFRRGSRLGIYKFLTGLPYMVVIIGLIVVTAIIQQTLGLPFWGFDDK